MINIYISGKNKGVLEINVCNISDMSDLDYTCTVKDFFLLVQYNLLFKDILEN